MVHCVPLLIGLSLSLSAPCRAVSDWPSSVDAEDSIEICADDGKGAPAPRVALPKQVIRGPYLQLATSTSIIVRWRTDVPTSTRVWLRSSPTSWQRTYGTGSKVTEHSAQLSGLQPGTRYFYAVGDSGGFLAGGDKDHWFDTAPVAGAQKPVRIWVIGDPGVRGPKALAVRDAYHRYSGGRPTDLWIALGDNAYASGTDAEYQASLFAQHDRFLRSHVLWSVFGNHDSLSASSATQTGVYYEIFDLPTAGEAGGEPSGTEAYYSIDYANVHLVHLDSTGPSVWKTSAMAAWLKRDLAASKAEWTIAVWHHPPYSKGTHDSDTEYHLVQMRQNFVPILEAAGVDLVICGHSHGYERSYMIDGHLGKSASLTPSMILDLGDGNPKSDGAYVKPSSGRAPHEGAVYVAAGNASWVNVAPLDHAAMVTNLNELGSMVIDVDGNRLDFKMIDDQGSIRDEFTIVKGVERSLVRVEPRIALSTGGKQDLRLDVGSAFDKHTYLILSSASTSPGFGFGGIQVPLSQDAWFFMSAALANSSTYQNSLNKLGALGRATATLSLPKASAPSLLGKRVYHAALVFDASLRLKRVSSPVHLTFVK